MASLVAPSQGTDCSARVTVKPFAPSVPIEWIWGLPLARLDARQTVDLVDQMIRSGQPGFFITANLHYARLCDQDPRLAEVNRQAAFIVADGMPLVWYSRLVGRALPERVAGSELIYALCGLAARQQYRVFFLGGAPGVAEQAAKRLTALYPGLPVAGTAAPEVDRLDGHQQQALVHRIRLARPQLLFVALGQPKGELWLAAHCQALGVPVGVQVGAAFDFVAGRVRRAPRWMQSSGLEWLYRIAQQPERLAPRYAQDAWFLIRAVGRDLRAGISRSLSSLSSFPFARRVDSPKHASHPNCESPVTRRSS